MLRINAHISHKIVTLNYHRGLSKHRNYKPRYHKMTAKYGSKTDIYYKSFTPTQNQDRLNMRLFEVNFRPRQIIMKLSNTIAVKFKKIT